MSRQVDLDNLTADDVEYMRQRPWLITEAKLRGVENIEELLEAAKTGDPVADTKEFVAPEPVDYSEKKLTELRKLAEARELDSKGTKKELVERLSTHDQIDPITSAEAAGAVGADGPAEPVTGDPVTDTTPTSDDGDGDGDDDPDGGQE